MKRQILILLLLFLSWSFSYAQDDTLATKKRIYKTWVCNQYKPVITTGVLYDVEDSSIVLAKYLKRNFSDFTMIKYNNIGTIRLRNKNSTINRILIGSISSMVIGGLIGFSLGDDPLPCKFPCVFYLTAEEKALIGGISGVLLGAGTGAMTGSISIKIPIAGNINNFNTQKSRLKKYSAKNWN